MYMLYLEVLTRQRVEITSLEYLPSYELIAIYPLAINTFPLFSFDALSLTLIT